MAGRTSSPDGGSDSSGVAIPFAEPTTPSVEPTNIPLVERTTTGSPNSGSSGSGVAISFAEPTLIELTITVSSDGGSNSSETSNSFVEPTDTPIVELATPLVTVTPPGPTSRSRLTYNPTMDYTPTRAGNTPFTANMEYTPYMEDNPNMEYNPSASAGSALAPHMGYNPTPVASNMFLFGSGPSGDVRVNSLMGMGQTTSSPTTGTYLTPLSNQTRPSGNRRSATNPRPFYNAARIARGNARAAAHHEAATAAAEAAATAASYGPHSREYALYYLSLLEESKVLNLAAFKEHSKNLYQSRVGCALMRASPDAASRWSEIEVMELAIVALVQAVKGYGHRFETLQYEIEQKYSDLIFGNEDGAAEGE